MSTQETTEHKFKKFIHLLKIIPKTPCDNDLLLLYGYYKQATLGDCNIPKPNNVIFDQKPLAKWKAWNNNLGMDKQTAMLNYINKVSLLIQQ